MNKHTYIYESEILTKMIYNNKKDQENLSTLLAIKYSKTEMALKIGLDDEAKKEFEEAEKMRKEYKGRPRSDIYTNIAIYYYKQENYEKAKEYTIESINMMNNIKQYKLDVIIMKILLGNTYIKLDEIEKALEIAKEIDNINLEDVTLERKNAILKERLILYANIYQYYGELGKSIEHLEKAYELITESNDRISKKRILNKLIDLNQEVDNKKALLYWYEEDYKMHEDENYLEKNQYLMSKIIDTDNINAQADMKILELERKNLLYTEIILIIVLMIIIIVIGRLKYLNRHDDLTKIYNRGYFNKTYIKYTKNKENYILCIFDIDNFKKLNDTYGHDFGDIVLINISKCIKNIMNKDCKLFRYGGEEFVVLINNDNIEYALKVAEDIRKRIEIMTWKENVTVTISMGVAASEYETDDVLKKADQNLYKSKMNGKNRVTYSKIK